MQINMCYMNNFVLSFVGLTHGIIEILLRTFRTDCADLHRVNTETETNLAYRHMQPEVSMEE